MSLPHRVIKALLDAKLQRPLDVYYDLLESKLLQDVNTRETELFEELREARIVARFDIPVYIRLDGFDIQMTAYRYEILARTGQHKWSYECPECELYRKRIEELETLLQKKATVYREVG